MSWYHEASGGKNPLEFDVKVRFGTAWHKYKELYIDALRTRATALNEKGNRRAAQIIRYHLLSLTPLTLPYEVKITGVEWPVVASCLLSAVARAKGNVKQRYTTLYQRCVRARTAAGHEHVET